MGLGEGHPDMWAVEARFKGKRVPTLEVFTSTEVKRDISASLNKLAWEVFPSYYDGDDRRRFVDLRMAEISTAVNILPKLSFYEWNSWPKINYLHVSIAHPIKAVHIVMNRIGCSATKECLCYAYYATIDRWVKSTHVIRNQNSMCRLLPQVK